MYKANKTDIMWKVWTSDARKYSTLISILLCLLVIMVRGRPEVVDDDEGGGSDVGSVVGADGPDRGSWLLGRIREDSKLLLAAVLTSPLSAVLGVTSEKQVVVE